MYDYINIHLFVFAILSAGRIIDILVFMTSSRLTVFSKRRSRFSTNPASQPSIIICNAIIANAEHRHPRISLLPVSFYFSIKPVDNSTPKYNTECISQTIYIHFLSPFFLTSGAATSPRLLIKSIRVPREHASMRAIALFATPCVSNSVI